jgi:cephalosporin hydroxylase
MKGVVNRLRARVGGPLDRPAPHWLVRAMGVEPPPPIDLDRIQLLRDADPADLRDPQRLEAMLPELGIIDERPELFPAELRPKLGQGLFYWQYPCQLAPYLSLVSQRPVRRYLELGVQHGGTFVLTTEYLDRFHAIEKAIAVDIMRVRSGSAYHKRRPAARFVTVDSSEHRFRDLLEREGPFDLVLIDGDHAREAVQRDWDTVRPYASVIAFHDIVDSLSPGVAEVWARVREAHAGEYDFHEFTRQYPEVQEREQRTFLGIGVAVKKG